MKVSKLIKELQTLKRLHGDKPVVFNLEPTGLIADDDWDTPTISGISEEAVFDVIRFEEGDGEFKNRKCIVLKPDWSC